MSENVKRAEESLGKETEIYSRRFCAKQEKLRATTWSVLGSEFFQKYIPKDGVVVDVGAGEGFFLRNIEAKRKIAVDLNPTISRLAEYGIETYNCPASELGGVLLDGADVVFMSNFLEHLPTKAILLDVLSGARKILKPQGKLLVLQPNIRYAKAAYWDYIDHHIALTEHSLAEALDISGFQVQEMIPRFLPYTAKSKSGKLATGDRAETMVRLYLRFPFLWKIFGQQTFVVARPHLG